MITPAHAGYALYLLLILGGGLIAVTSPSLIRALTGLIVALFGVAGMYLLLNSPFLAFMQLLIYAGAVTVLIFFAIMLTRPPAGGEEAAEKRPAQKGLAALASLLVFLPLVGLWFLSGRQTVKIPLQTPVAELGQGLLGPYVLAFELISVVLLAAMIGAVVLTFTRRQEK